MEPSLTLQVKQINVVVVVFFIKTNFVVKVDLSFLVVGVKKMTKSLLKLS